ncbi:hypothetical protein DSCA_05810 [Desulfosarcina alkanivorans]|uniref:Sel1 repeat family protein n=1 Tax=Desulfosarcina alkanivorans TaxID=571177 RepID=A0A5K7YIS5_9BACT|nr:sel1 repeat family protein [Desulfosarcina alkanivorans]BBO66651.1 hypothetical protein DSCA_05810 [Desulfosarcina alkanivorans]
MKPVVVFFSILFFWAAAAGAVDRDEKLSLLESAVAGDTEAQFRLAQVYKDEAEAEDLFEPDMRILEKAVHWYEQAASNGHRPSALALLDIYDGFYGEEKASWPEKWVLLAQKMAAAGDRIAQFKLAGHYERQRNSEGADLRQCIARASDWYTRLLQGLPPDQAVVFQPYEIGLKAITRKDIETRLARINALDPQIEEKKKKLALLYASAVESGRLTDLIQLGDRCARENSTDQEVDMAIASYRRAAERNSVEAQIKLARLRYRLARDPHDYQEAYFWAMAAAMGNEPTAPELLARIAENLPAEQLPAMEAEATEAITRLQRQ